MKCLHTPIGSRRMWLQRFLMTFKRPSTAAGSRRREPAGALRGDPKGANVLLTFAPRNNCTVYRDSSSHFAATIFTDSTLSVGAATPAVAEAGLTVPVIST